MQMRLLLLLLFTVACNPSSSSATKADAGRDGASDALSVSLPDLPPGCPPSAGNEVGIGKPCTATGNECGTNLQCSCKNWFGYTMPAGLPCFCTNIAFGATCATNCGNNATCCTYDDVPVSTSTAVTISACFPSVCAPAGQCPSIAP